MKINTSRQLNKKVMATTTKTSAVLPLPITASSKTSPSLPTENFFSPANVGAMLEKTNEFCIQNPKPNRMPPHVWSSKLKGLLLKQEFMKPLQIHAASLAQEVPEVSFENLASYKPKPVQIVGAGIAGLTIAAALHQQGVPFKIHERFKNKEQTCSRANSILIRDDGGFKIIPFLAKIFPPNVIQRIKDASIPFGKPAPGQTPNKTNNLLINIGYLQKIMIEHLESRGVNITYGSTIADGDLNSMQQDKNECIIDARGVNKNSKSKQVAAIGEPISTTFNHYLADEGMPFENWGAIQTIPFKIGPSSIRNVKHHTITFPLNSEKSIHDFESILKMMKAAKDSTLSETKKGYWANKIKELNTLNASKQVEKYSYTVIVVHQKDGTNPHADITNHNQPIMSVSLQTIPNITIPGEERTAIPGDSGSKPHPWGGHGTIHVFETVSHTLAYIERKTKSEFNTHSSKGEPESPETKKAKHAPGTEPKASMEQKSWELYRTMQLISGLKTVAFYLQTSQNFNAQPKGMK